MNFWNVLLISVICFYTRTAGLVPQKLPESWKCADPKCSVPISAGKPVLKQYNGLNLSFKKDQKVIIYGKGSKHYFVEVEGKRGHIPKNFVLETRVFVKDADLKHVVTPATKLTPIETTPTEDQVEINAKTIPETKAEPIIDIGNLKPEIAPVMPGSFLLAGAAADDSGTSSLPKIPDAVPDAVKNAADATPPEDEKILLDAPAGVTEPDVFDDEVDPDLEIEDDVDAGLSNDDDDDVLDVNAVENNITDTAGSNQNEPGESGTKIEASGDTKVDSANDTTAVSLNNTAALESSNDTKLETKDVINDTTPYVVSKLDNTTDYITDSNVIGKESVDKIPDEAKVEEATVEYGILGFMGTTVDTKVAGKREEGEAGKQLVDESSGDSPVEDVNLTENEAFKGVKLPVGIEIDVGVDKDIDGGKLDDSVRNVTEEVEKSDKLVEKQTEKIVESYKNVGKIEETQTEKIVESKVESVGSDSKVESIGSDSKVESIGSDSKVESIGSDSKVESIGSDSKVESIGSDSKVESIGSDSKVESIGSDSKVESIGSDSKVESIVSDSKVESIEIEAENVTESETVTGGAYVENVSDKSEGLTKQDDEVNRSGRVKRDFMYQQNQYAYNAHPNYQQTRGYGDRINEYNTNNYRQYQTEYPNAYGYQQQYANMHHSNKEANMHHQNIYHNNHANTQLPPKVETITARASEPEILVSSTQAPTESTPVTSKPDYEDVSVEVDDHSGEVVTDTHQEEETTVPPTQVPTSSESTSSETAAITDKPEVEVVHEEEKVEEEHPVKSTEPHQEVEEEEEAVVTKEEPTEPGGSWFSLKTITDLFSSEKSDDVDSKSNEETPASVLPSNEEEPKLADDKCSTDHVTCELNKLEAKLLDGEFLSSDPFISESDNLLGALMDSLQKTTSGPIFCLIVTACAVVGFSLGYNFIENRKREGELVAKINSLEKENLVEKKEKNQLKDKLQYASKTLTLSSDAEASYLSQIAALTEQRDSLIAEKRDLEDQLVETERELQTATESNLEINNLLSESLNTADGSSVLLETVETLRKKLEHQNMEVKQLNMLLNEKSEEIDNIRKELKANQEAKKLLQDKVAVLKREKDEELLQLKESNRDLSTQLDDLMESKSLEKLKLSNELSKLQITLTETQTMLGDRNGEIDALKDVISRLKTNLKEEDLNNLYDVASVSGKLTHAEKERDRYKEKFFEEEGARKFLEDHVRVISQEVASLKENYEAAEKEKIDALTKVQVLSNYFKEKETQLQKELGLKESMWLQKQSDDNTIYEQMKSLREENERYKNDQSQLHATNQLNCQRQNQPPLQDGVLCVTKKKKKKVKGNPGTSQPTSGLQLESLQKEIRESETDYKSQVAKAEQKSYENWLTSRQYERKLKESQGEATQLRNMLTLIEKNATNHSTDDLKQSISESNGDPSSPPPRFLPPPPTSPPFMMFQPPPPHHDYIPPPPLVYPEVAAAARPPTLGRISSPPLDHPRFSPPHHMPPPPYLFDPSPPYSPSAGGGHHHHSPSPPPPPPHRPLPKPHMSAADQKESNSPGYSEHHERPNRRSKR